jgi:hypothetical protein
MKLASTGPIPTICGSGTGLRASGMVLQKCLSGPRGPDLPPFFSATRVTSAASATDRGHVPIRKGMLAWPLLNLALLRGSSLYRIGQGAPPRRASPPSVIFARPSAPMAMPSASVISLRSCTVLEAEECRPIKLQKILMFSLRSSLARFVSLNTKAAFSAAFLTRCVYFLDGSRCVPNPGWRRFAAGI